jgi:carbon-monoxide dehydrogenase small subunit
MSRIALTVNGAAVSAEVEPRTHLADFLRETLLLTGTHLGCEHGVCGACTILIDGEPARSCIAYAAACDGRDVRSIEGLADDPVMVRLREAFTAEHALQCGYCTPGMLVTARDIVRRLPDADEDRIRLELAGNLCRCTGYNGIVRAIARVLADPPMLDAVAPAPVPSAAFPAAVAVTGAAPKMPASSPTLQQRVALSAPRAAVWAALQDPALIAACVPGAAITSVEDGRIAGTMAAGLGPIRARFSGQGTIAYDAANFAGTLAGEGADAVSGTRLQGRADFRVEEAATGSVLVLDVSYGLRGALAQFARGPLVRAFADEIAGQVGRNLEARLSGQPGGWAAPPPGGRAAPPPGGSFVLRALWRWLRGLLRR